MRALSRCPFTCGAFIHPLFPHRAQSDPTRLSTSTPLPNFNFALLLVLGTLSPIAAMSSQTPGPLRVTLFSTADRPVWDKLFRRPNVRRGDGDVLVVNDPFNREYHLAVINTETGRFVYDLPARCEPRGAIAVPVDGQARVALIRQWRAVPAATSAESSFPPTVDDDNVLTRRGFWSWELPRGFPSPGESGAEAARREVEEETRLRVAAVRPLGWSNFNTAVMMSDQPIYAVRVDEKAELTDDFDEEGEKIDGLRWFTMDELRNLVASGQLRCGITLGALSYAFASEGKLRNLADMYGNTCSIGSGDAGRDAGMRHVFRAFERYVCEMWELGIDVAHFDIELVRFSVGSQEELSHLEDALRSRGAVVGADSADGAGSADSGVVWNLSSRPMQAFGATVSKISITLGGSEGGHGRGDFFVSSDEDISTILEHHPALQRASGGGGGKNEAIRSANLTVHFARRRRDENKQV